ncbi:MAG: DegT/DnrJ/EryC1/StrS family aminotransferase [Cellvibrio sp.]|nr:DegT/DnrJ/EryC1/StrS family aminotransferase [Cellvibrio sp.]
METLRALIRGDLAPAGYPISSTISSNRFNFFPENYHAHWLDSGTSSLAVALMDCKSRRSDVESPQVIIPGYCCPDLVAAAVYAGVEPLVVDIAVDDPSYDLDQLAAAINSRVIAVIAINFLGLSERLAAVRQILQQRPETVYLIEDNAQWFPEKANTVFESDYVTFSFGRGKPLSLLGGGVLLAKQSLAFLLHLVEGEKFGWKQKLKIKVYNNLLNPHWYAFVNRAPFLHLGEPRYHPLASISAAADAVHCLLVDNFSAYQERSADVECFYQQQLQSVQQLQALSSERKQRLLRYPLLLATPAHAATLYKQLAADGLGASLMYRGSLEVIPGVAGKIQCFSSLARAKSFASRLITLPVHCHVRQKHFEKIKKVLTLKINCNNC